MIFAGNQLEFLSHSAVNADCCKTHCVDRLHTPEIDKHVSDEHMDSSNICQAIDMKAPSSPALDCVTIEDEPQSVTASGYVQDSAVLKSTVNASNHNSQACDTASPIFDRRHVPIKLNAVTSCSMQLFNEKSPLYAGTPVKDSVNTCEELITSSVHMNLTSTPTTVCDRAVSQVKPVIEPLSVSTRHESNLKHLLTVPSSATTVCDRAVSQVKPAIEPQSVSTPQESNTKHILTVTSTATTVCDHAVSQVKPAIENRRNSLPKVVPVVYVNSSGKATGYELIQPVPSPSYFNKPDDLDTVG